MTHYVFAPNGVSVTVTEEWPYPDAYPEGTYALLFDSKFGFRYHEWNKLVIGSAFTHWMRVDSETVPPEVKAQALVLGVST